ncbi:hypothetical protein [Thalassotalea aquiviva]|uniref:hypothetical protein n=1 Tax=Thalassotalea aquiviva TaxID=3242415 RepID=UPI00352B1914
MLGISSGWSLLAKTAFTSLAIDLDKDAKQFIIRNMLFKKMVSYALEQKFGDDVSLKSVEQQGVIVEHKTYGEILVLPKKLTIFREKVEFVTDVELLTNKTTSESITTLISGVVQGVASSALFALSAGYLGASEISQSLFKIGSSMVHLVNGKGDKLGLGKDRVFSLELPDSIKHSNLVSLFFGDEEQSIAMALDMRNGDFAIAIAVENFDMEKLEAVKTKSMALIGQTILGKVAA